VGAGGVGSWAALMLARSGIGRIRVIDFDQVTLSSLNRHAVATRADVGTSKVVALQAHLRRIVPLTEVDARVAMFSSADADELLQGNPDYVLDCIDNIDTKVDLLTYCHQHQLPVISSMGAGAKADPSRIQLSDISDTFGKFY
jgi:tRNA A37 threonylcarbamoyladenosine dehydratase